MPARLAFFMCGAWQLLRFMTFIWLLGLSFAVSANSEDAVSKEILEALDILLTQLRATNNIDFKDQSVSIKSHISAISATLKLSRFASYEGEYSLNDKLAFVESDLSNGRTRIYVRDDINLSEYPHTLNHELVHVVQYYLWYQDLNREPVPKAAHTLKELNAEISSGDPSQYYLSLGRLKARPVFRQHAEELLLAFVNVKVCMEYQAMQLSGEMEEEGQSKQKTRQDASFFLNNGTVKKYLNRTYSNYDIDRVLSTCPAHTINPSTIFRLYQPE